MWLCHPPTHTHTNTHVHIFDAAGENGRKIWTFHLANIDENCVSGSTPGKEGSDLVSTEGRPSTRVLSPPSDLVQGRKMIHAIFMLPFSHRDYGDPPPFLIFFRNWYRKMLLKV